MKITKEKDETEIKLNQNLVKKIDRFSTSKSSESLFTTINAFILHNRGLIWRCDAPSLGRYLGKCECISENWRQKRSSALSNFLTICQCNASLSVTNSDNFCKKHDQGSSLQKPRPKKSSFQKAWFRGSSSWSHLFQKTLGKLRKFSHFTIFSFMRAFSTTG